VLLDQSRINPLSALVKVGSSHKITCNTHTPPKWALDDDGKQCEIGKYTGIKNSLILKKVTSSIGGAYICKGKTKKSDVFYAKSILRVLSKLLGMLIISSYSCYNSIASLLNFYPNLPLLLYFLFSK